MAMKKGTSCLSAERRNEVCHAFCDWYGQVDKKRKAMLDLGVPESSIGGFTSAFKSGVRIPPPWLLAALWKKTADKRFLFTSQEKAQKLAQGRAELPTVAEWPDLDATPVLEGEPRSEGLPQAAAPLSEVLSAHGGETSPLGIPMVLGEKSFVLIDLDPSEELIVTVERLVQTLRGLLNLLAQIRDDHMRDLVRKRLSPQIEELELAIRLFSDVHPNRLTKLHDDQRRAWSPKKS